MHLWPVSKTENQKTGRGDSVESGSDGGGCSGSSGILELMIINNI